MTIDNHFMWMLLPEDLCEGVPPDVLLGVFVVQPWAHVAHVLQGGMLLLLLFDIHLQHKCHASKVRVKISLVSFQDSIIKRTTL